LVGGRHRHRWWCWAIDPSLFEGVGACHPSFVEGGAGGQPSLFEGVGACRPSFVEGGAGGQPSSFEGVGGRRPSSFEGGGRDEGVSTRPPSFVVGDHRRWCMVGPCRHYQFQNEFIPPEFITPRIVVLAGCLSQI
jgi:hypothetical protein